MEGIAVRCGWGLCPEGKEKMEISDDYTVDGIDIDWKKTFKFHDKLNKLRAKHGIRQIPPISADQTPTVFVKVVPDWIEGENDV